MLLHFLSAARPLTKTFALDDNGNLDKSPYPLVKDFTSYAVEVGTIEQFHDALTEHANLNHCLLKGALAAALNDEPRAGSTNSLDATTWLVLDIDGIHGHDSAASFLAAVLPPEFSNTDYILQQSASAGFNSAGLRCHAFFLLDKPVVPDLLKTWITHVNLTRLSDQLQLSASGHALKWPLDRTVCQNDKLIYIAPPILEGELEDPLHGQRITLVKAEHRTLNVSKLLANLPPPATIEHLTRQKTDSLRGIAGMPKAKAKYKQTGEHNVLLNPEKSIITSIKQGRGFVYLNLNGGDSFAYYYPEDNPSILHNFKGEHAVFLKDIAPDYYNEISRKKAPVQNARRLLVFHDGPTDKYFAGIYDSTLDEILELNAIGSKDKIDDYCANYKQVRPEPMPDYRYAFDPHTHVLVDFENRFVNKWQATDYIKNAVPNTTIPHTINRVIRSVVGNDEECYQHFINWLAYIFQFRDKTLTAWIFHGVQGTGKGVLINEVIRPLLGDAHVLMKQMRDIEDRFNEDMERCLIFNLDETRLQNSSNESKVLNMLKNWITEPKFTMRGMRQNAESTTNYMNFIFTSNDYDALMIDATDRRFNVAPRQESRIVLDSDDIDRIRTELMQFAGYLAGYTVNADQARTALNNPAKAAMREASMDSVEQLCSAFSQGNLDYFVAFIENGPSAPEHLLAYAAFASKVREWTYIIDQQVVLPLNEMMAAYNYLLSPGKPMGALKFQRMLAHKNIIAKDIHFCTKDNKPARGFPVTWQATEAQQKYWVTAINKAAPILRSVNF